ncbi:MAG TPA: hypothetical protein VFJ90_06525 [Candidatus Didemnitutus sp.]|nr:hypothetical protein [Candidatus Didemnitutus sp.]
MSRSRLRPGLRFLLVAVAIVSIGAGRSFASEPAGPATRQTGTFEGIEFEYSPGREELARRLAHRIVLYNEAIAETRRTAQAGEKDPTMIPLSPAEMRANRSVYLGHIADLLSLGKPTALQVECYDAFLDNYEQTMRLVALTYASAEELRTVKRVTIWDRPELVQRLEHGEKVAGFSYDPNTNQGRVTYGVDRTGRDEQLAQLGEKRKKLHRDYRLAFETKDGVETVRAQVRPATPAAKPHPDNVVDAPMTKEQSADKTDWFPIVIPADATDFPAEKLAAQLWNPADDRSMVKMLMALAKVGQSAPTTDPTIAFLVLHETIEVGITDRYFHSADRRWFCDGVANYGAWRILHDIHGEQTATQAHNRRAALAGYSDLRDQADLRKWPATENQSTEDQNSRLNSARYLFAEQAVFLMNRHAGDDVLPRLFKEIGKTKPSKVSMGTIDAAWTKITGTKLDDILQEAVKPEPAAIPAVD